MRLPIAQPDMFNAGFAENRFVEAMHIPAAPNVNMAVWGWRYLKQDCQGELGIPEFQFVSPCKKKR